LKFKFKRIKNRKENRKKIKKGNKTYLGRIYRGPSPPERLHRAHTADGWIPRAWAVASGGPHLSGLSSSSPYPFSAWNTNRTTEITRRTRLSAATTAGVSYLLAATRTLTFLWHVGPLAQPLSLPKRGPGTAHLLPRARIRYCQRDPRKPRAPRPTDSVTNSTTNLRFARPVYISCRALALTHTRSERTKRREREGRGSRSAPSSIVGRRSNLWLSWVDLRVLTGCYRGFVGRNRGRGNRQWLVGVICFCGRPLATAGMVVCTDIGGKKPPMKFALPSFSWCTS
jgi:hypothetical protein